MCRDTCDTDIKYDATPWNGLKRVLVIDTESYVDTRSGHRRLLALAFEIIHTDSGHTSRQGYHIVSPSNGYHSDPRSQRIHGLTPDDISTHGEDVVGVLNLLVELVDQVGVVAAHDISADIAVVVSEAVRVGHTNIMCSLYNARHICTKIESTSLCRIPLAHHIGPQTCWKWPSLWEAVQVLLGDAPTERTHHSCPDDVRMCSRVILRLYNIHTQ